ncbi:MAG: hypothetical protein FJ271_30240 [Planctomycetes bacterium]|nr:hypothetical protein [Planctomycetota bacterium]
MSSRSRAGFSQVEILVAVAVLSIGILGVCATFAFALRAESQAGALTEAVGYARTMTELIRVNNLPFKQPVQPELLDGANTRRALNEAPFASDLPAGTPFTRNISVQLRSNQSGNYLNTVARITVTIFWYDRGTERRYALVSEHRQP